MSRMPMKKSALLLLGALLAQPLMAMDVATEQYNVAVARKQYDDSRTEYDHINQQVELQAQRVAEGNARLNELRKRQKAAKVRLEKSRALLAQQEKALDQAWTARNN